jgi:hypothetical protein
MQATASKTQQTELTEVQSQTYIRNMIRAGFSSILYLRGIFDESHFIDRTLCGVNIKALVPKDGNASTFTQWIESGVFDALQKKYVRKIAQNQHFSMIRIAYLCPISSPKSSSQSFLEFTKTLKTMEAC